MNRQLCCLYLTLPVRHKKRHFPCCQSLKVSTTVLYNKGSQEALQTGTNYVKLHTVSRDRTAFCMRRRGEGKVRWWLRAAQNPFLLLLCLCSNIHPILMHPHSYYQSAANSLHILTASTVSVWSRESYTKVMKYRQKTYCCPNCNSEKLTWWYFLRKVIWADLLVFFYILTMCSAVL